MHQNVQWEREDFAYALERAVLTHASPRAVKRKGARIFFNGWWREGDSSNVVVNTYNASFFDFKTAEHGGPKLFAEIVFGMSLPQFMERFGPTGTQREEWVRPPPPPPPRGDVHELWQRLLAQPRDGARRWLIERRGISVIDRVPKAYCEVDLQATHLFPEDLVKWAARRVRESGPMIALPLYDVHGEVRNIHMRPLGIEKPGGGQRTFLPRSALTHGETPVCYGPLSKDALACDHLVIVEGALDELAARLALPHDTTVVGAPSSSTLHNWGAYLRAKTRGVITVVPHLDQSKILNGKEVGYAGQVASAKLVAKLTDMGIPARLFDWDTFHRLLDVDPAKVTDVADACKLVSFSVFERALRDALKGGWP